MQASASCSFIKNKNVNKLVMDLTSICSNVHIWFLNYNEFVPTDADMPQACK